MNEQPADGFPDGPSTLSALTRLSEDVHVSPALRALHDEILSRLRKEASAAPHFGTLQDILLERTATQFVLVKHREEEALGDQRVIKELNALLISFIGEVYKQARYNSDISALRELIHGDLMDALDTATESMDPDARRALRSRMADALEAVG